MKRIKPYEYSYTVGALNAAIDKWGCNCGPAALATMVGISNLDKICGIIPHFKERHYTNPSMMQAALRTLKVKWHEVDDSNDREALGKGGRPALEWPLYGLVRIQWEGPWLNLGEPPAGTYKHTHWVGCINTIVNITYTTMIFDFNVGWGTLESWENGIVRTLTSQTKDATGGYRPTHRWELELL